MVLAFSVAIHMEISRSDILSGLRGLGVISALLLILDVVLGLLFPMALSAVTAACVSAGVFIALLMLIPAVFSFIIGSVSVLMIFFRGLTRPATDRSCQPSLQRIQLRRMR